MTKGNEIRKFRTEEELIEYYELRAVDAYDRSDDNCSPMIKALKNESDRIPQNQKPTTKRDRSDSLRKNINKYEKTHKNLNDSRENDFDGFDDDDFYQENNNIE